MTTKEKLLNIIEHLDFDLIDGELYRASNMRESSEHALDKSRLVTNLLAIALACSKSSDSAAIEDHLIYMQDEIRSEHESNSNVTYMMDYAKERS